MSIKILVLLFALASACGAKEVTVGGRVQFEYDDTRWQRRPTTVPGADVVQLVDEAGTFTVLVMPEKRIAGGLSSVESRRRYFEQLAKTNARTEDVRPVEIAGKTGFEFLGKRDREGIEYRMRIVLIVDAGDVLILMSSAQGMDPMSAPSIAAVWKSFMFP